MKRIWFISCGIFLIAGLVFFGFGLLPQGFAADPKQVIKITWAEQNNDMGYGPKYSEAPYLKRIEEATGNRVKFEVFWGQTLVKGPDIWNAVKTGLVDAGWCFHNYWPGMTELANAISLPGLPFKDVEHASAVMYQIYQEFPSIQAEFKDVHVLTTWCDGHEVLLSRSKQVKTLEDMKGLKVRATGMNLTNLMTTLGAVPVTFPMPDAYLSLDRGVIDGMTAPWEAAVSFKLDEVAKYLVPVPWTFFHFTYSMNKAKWNSLPKDIQDAITKVNDLENARRLSRDWEATAKQEFLKISKGKVEPITMPEAEMKKLAEIAKPLREEWVKKMTAAGRPDAGKVLKRIEELIPQTAK
jgi:TRAP-type transport system periplasmic protein